VISLQTIFLPDDSLTNRISYYHLMMLLVFLPFDMFFTHVVFISFALHTLLHVKKERLKQLFTPGNAILQAVFFTVLLSVSYTSFTAKAWTDVTRLLLILLFPLLFSLNPLNIDQYRDRLLFVFSLTCTLTIAYLYLHVLILIRYFGLPLSDLFSHVFLNQNFSDPINMHATFFSLQVAVAFFYCLSRLFKAETLNYRLFYLAFVLLLFAGLVQLGSKAVLITILLALNLAVPFFIIPKPKRLKYIWATATFSVVFIVGLLATNSLRARYVTGLKTDLSNPVLAESVEPRLSRWNASLQLVAKKPLFGYGAGSEVAILGDQFFNKKLYISYLNRFNAHNQYLTFLLITGIVGLLVYLLTLAYGFKMALAKKDLLFFIFLLLIAMVSLSESVLNAEKGVFFYSLFFSLFVFSTQNEQIKINQKQGKYLVVEATPRALVPSL
jgi:O-antigen ligase